MNEGWKRFHGTDEEVMWRIQVLKRTSRLCAAKAKELERMAKADGDMPAMEHTDEPVFYDAELGLYVWGVTTYGTSWTILPAPEIH